MGRLRSKKIYRGRKPLLEIVERGSGGRQGLKLTGAYHHVKKRAEGSLWNQLVEAVGWKGKGCDREG